MGGARKVVIIGCSGTGALAARMLKRMDPSVDVTIIREPEERGLLTRCATPYICCGDVLVNPSYKDDAMFLNAGIRLVDARAEAVDREKKRVETEGGGSHPYDVLVLATGARPVVPPVPGIDVEGVFTLRTSEDAFRMLYWMNSRRVKSAVVLGAGAVGVEITCLVAAKGVDVRLVEMREHLLPRALDADMSRNVEEYIRARGVDLRLGERAAAVGGKKEVESVTLSPSGEEIPAEMLVVAVGARPRSELAEKAGLEMGEAGVKVNAYLQTSDPDIYAAGDLIEYPSHVTGKPVLGQLRPNAVIGGRVIARNILGRPTTYPPLVNGFATKCFDKSIAGTGITEEEAEREGIETIGVIRTADHMHSMMRGRKPYAVKVIFDRRNARLIGAQIVSDSPGPVKHIDALTVAIRSDWTAGRLATLRCAGQPELSPDPGKEPIALAAAEAELILEAEGGKP